MKPELARGLYSAAAYLLTPVALLRLGVKSQKNSGYRQHIGERFGFVASPQRRDKHIHFHAVSVGETLAAVPMIKSLSQAHDDWRISISVSTPTGREQAQKHLVGLAEISYLPFDTPGAVQRFLDRVKPDLMVMVETELWPNLVHQCHKRKISTLLMNGRMSAKSAQSYLKMASLTKQMMSEIDLVLAQFSEDKNRFIELGCAAESVVTSGNLKFDANLSEQVKSRAQMLRSDWQLQDRPVWIAASTHLGEEEIILELHKKLLLDLPNLLLILVPRHPERRPEIESLIVDQNLKAVVRSEIDEHAVLGAENSVMLVDTLGELNLFYGLSDLAFVAGSLIPHGGHNPIEPALWKLPVLTGQHCHNFMEITDQLVCAGSLIQCADKQELFGHLYELLQNPERRQQMGSAADQVIAQNQGSLDRQRQQIEELISTRL